MRLGLLVRLLRNPGWIIGLACDVLGFVFQFIALGHGPLVVVQPLLVCGLLFALPIGAALAGHKLTASDWLAAVVVCAGLAVFLVVSSPASGRSNIRPGLWVLLLTTDAAAAFALVLSGRNSSPRARAVLLSAAAGIVYGAAAALTKTCSHLLDKGLWRVPLHWQPYVLIVAGVGGMLVAQSSFQAGWLDVSLPTMTVIDPVVSIVIGALAFRESIASNAAAILLEVIGLAAMSVGVFRLARTEAANSRALKSIQERPPLPT